MNSTTCFDESVRSETDLIELEIKIARRADELANSRHTGANWGDDWNCWYEAEQEILQPGHDPALV